MVTPNEERDIWARFRPAVQHAGGTLGQAFGQFAQLPGVRHVLGGLSAVQERGVNPFVSQVIAGLPLAKGDRRWESFRTPSGGLSPRAVIEQATPIALPAMLAKGTMGVLRENIPALRNLRIAPQDTIKAQRLRAEEARREASLGRDLTGTELRMMEQEMYALPKHMRGALQEAPWFFLPSAGAAKVGLSATRAGISGAGKLGRAAPLARGGLRVAETALTPVEIAERATAKVIASPFKAAGAVGKAAKDPISRATRPARIGIARAIDPDMGKGRQFQRIGGEKEAEVLGELGLSDVKISDPQFSVDSAKLRPYSFDRQRIKESYSTGQIRSDARRIYDRNPDIDIDDAFELSDAKFYAPIKRWTSPEERGIVKDIFRKDQLTPKQIFDDEFLFHKNKKLGKENFGYNAARRFRDLLGKTKSRPVDNAVHEIDKVAVRSGFRAVANKMGKVGSDGLDHVFKGLAKRIPTADSYVKLKMKLHDEGEIYRVMADSGARAQTLFSDNWLAQRYVSPAVRLPRALGSAAIEGTNEYKNFKEIADAKLQAAGVTTHEGNLMVVANRIDELMTNLPERKLNEILPKYFDEFNAKLKGLDPDTEAYRVNSKGEVLSPHYQKMTLEMINQRKGQRVVLDSDGNKVGGFDNFDGAESSGFYSTIGKTDASGRTANYTREQYEALVEYAEEVRELYRRQRKKMLDSGIISQSEYDSLSRYKWYAPIHFPAQRDLGNEVAEKIISRNAELGNNVLDNGIYNLVRDTSAATMEARGWLPVTGHSMLYDLINVEQRIAKNNATKEFVELILGRGQANLKDVSDDYIRFKVRIKDKKGNFSYRNMTRTELQTYKSYKKWGSDYRGRSPRTGTKGDVIDTRTPVTEVLLKIPYDDDLASGYFSFYKEGRRFVYGNSEGKPVPKILWDSINSRAGLAHRSEKERYAMWKASNGFFRSVYTQQNPLFMVRNSFIDSLTVQLNAGVGMHKSAANIINNLKDIRSMEDAWIDIYNRTGPVAMKGGWNADKAVDEMLRKAKEANQNPTFIEWNQVKLANKVLRKNGLDKLKRFMPALGTATEMGPRMAVFKKSLSKTVGDREAQRLADLKKSNPDRYDIEMKEDWVPQFDANNNRISNPVSRNTGYLDSIEVQKAAQNATEATLDFARGGELIKKWNEYILFMNPAFEGTKLPFRAVGFDLSPVVKTVTPDNLLTPEQLKVRRATRIAARKRAREAGVEYVEPITEWGSWSDQARKYIRGGFGERGMTGMGFDVVSGGPNATIARLGMVAGTFWAIQMGHNKTQQYNGVPLYYDIPEYIRYNSMVFMLDADKDEAGDYIIDPKTGRPTPKYIVFPHRLREWNMFFQLGTFMDEYTDKTVPMDKSKFFEHYLTSASPIGIDPLSAFVPEALNVGIETLTGRDYYRDRDVVDEEYQQLPLDQQYNKYTSKTARNIAGVFDDVPGVPEPFDAVIGSPQRLEHLSENLFGQIGKEVLNLSDIAADLFNDLINLEDKRPMKERVKSYRDDMSPTEQKEFLVSLTEKEYEEFEKELKESEATAPLINALKQSYYPERGGGISRLSRTLAQEQFKDVLDPDQVYRAGRQASKDRQRLKFRQDEDDEALANWRQDTAGRKLNPSEWRESHSTKWALYSYDLDKLAEQYPKSIYAQSDEVKDAYYNAIYTAAGRLKDSRDAADLLLAGYYAIQVPKEDPDKTQWNDYFRTRDEYEQKVKGLSEATGDGLYEEFVRRRQANNTETEKAYYAAMKLTSIYWSLGKSVDELYAGDLPRDAGYVSILQQQWDEYLNAGMPKKDALRKKSVTIRDMVKRRTELRKEFIKRDQALGMQKYGKPVSDIEAALVFWYGADYYRKPITAEANNLYRRLYLR